MKKVVRILAAGFIAACLTGSPAGAATVTLKIRAVNPQKESATVKVSRPLPSGINPDKDILNDDGMKIRFDQKAKAYLAEAEPVLSAGEAKTYSVVLRDVWSVPAAKIRDLELRAGAAARALATSRRAQTSAELKRGIDAGIAELKLRQAQYAVESVRATVHIGAFSKTIDVLNRVINDVAMLEKLAETEGIDPDKFQSAPAASEEAAAQATPVSQFQAAQSPTGKDKMPGTGNSPKHAGLVIILVCIAVPVSIILLVLRNRRNRK